MPEKKDNIELRSEKVRNIVGKVPPRLLRIGISVISIIIVSTLLIGYFIPYPQYETVSIKFYSNPLVQTEKAMNSGIYFSTIDTLLVSMDEQIGWIQGEDDSVIYYQSKIKGEAVLNLNNGDYIQKNDILYSIIPDSIQKIYAIGYINSEEIDRIKIGQSVSIPLKYKSLVGEIIEIFPFPNKEITTGKKVYKFKIYFPNNLFDINKEILLPKTEYIGRVLISNNSIFKEILDYIL